MDSSNDLVNVTVGGAIALIGKIVWDWLKEHSKPTQHETCKRLEDLEKAFHTAHLKLAEDMASVKSDMTSVKLDLAWIKERFEKNGKL